MENAPIQVVPDELWENIIGFLPIDSLFILSKVCKKLYDIAHTSTYYKMKMLETVDIREMEKEFIVLSPFCNCQMKQFKYVNIWGNLPIRFTIGLYHFYILGIENVILNYLHRCSSIFNLSIEIPFNTHIVKFIEDHLPVNIKILSLIDHHTDPDRMGIEFNASKFPNVKNIKLSQLILHTDSNFANLITLELYYIYIELTEEHKIQLSNIKNLTLYYSLSAVDLTFLTQNEELTLIHISFNQELMVSLSKNKTLKKLTIYTYADSSTIDLSVFGTSNLECLVINSFGKYILNLNGLGHIKHLDLSGVRVSNIHYPMYNKVLNLSNCNIKQHMIPKLLNVEKLNISQNGKVRDTSIFSSKECNIKVLDLSNNEHIVNIDGLSNLEELSVIDCNPYIRIINKLSKLKHTRLYINSCYCKRCVLSYKYNKQQTIMKEHSITPTCLYKDKYNWFKL